MELALPYVNGTTASNPFPFYIEISWNPPTLNKRVGGNPNELPPPLPSSYAL